MRVLSFVDCELIVAKKMSSPPRRSETFLPIAESESKDSEDSDDAFLENCHSRSDSSTSHSSLLNVSSFSSTWSDILEYEAVELEISEDNKITVSSGVLEQLQRGIEHCMQKLPPALERDLLMTDFTVVDANQFCKLGASDDEFDFMFYNYAPIAFWFFRELYGISNLSFRRSLCGKRLKNVQKQGKNGSTFYATADELFILKTVQKKEAVFLTKLLAGYYLNFTQHSKTLLPKYYGLYCYRRGMSSVRILVMNNLLPNSMNIPQVYDLKGSEPRRISISGPTSHALKDSNFIEDHPAGFYMEEEMYMMVMKSVERDCHVLQSYQIVDYSLLLGVRPSNLSLTSVSSSSSLFSHDSFDSRLNFTQANNLIGPFEARNSRGERMFLYLGIIDILQSYDRQKKCKNFFKSLVKPKNSISVQDPRFYATRFQDFLKSRVIKCIPELKPYMLKYKRFDRDRYLEVE